MTALPDEGPLELGDEFAKWVHTARSAWPALGLPSWPSCCRCVPSCSYEDYLDNQITATDMFYLEDVELARQLVELG